MTGLPYIPVTKVRFTDYPSTDFFFFTEKRVAAAAVSIKRIRKPYARRFPDDSFIFTGELRAILLALSFRHVYHPKERSFLILSDSLSSLQAVANLKYDHSILSDFRTTYGIDHGWEGDFCVSRSPAMWALEEIWLQALLLRTLSMATSRMCSSPSQTLSVV